MNAKPKKSKKTDIDELEFFSSLQFDYGVNYKNRIITLSGMIGEQMDEDDCYNTCFEILDKSMNFLESLNDNPITIRISSFGGDVYERLAMVGRIRSSKCKVITEGYGKIFSAAVMLLACGHRRRLSKYATLMHHEPQYRVDYTRHSDIKSYVVQTDKEEALEAQYMAEFTKKSMDFWKNAGVYVDKYLTAEEALEYGIVDELI